jgi:hypothetical protein
MLYIDSVLLCIKDKKDVGALVSLVVSFKKFILRAGNKKINRIKRKINNIFIFNLFIPSFFIKYTKAKLIYY